MKILSFFVVLLCFISCNKGNKLEQEEVLFDSVPCCPHATIYLQPYDNFTQHEAKSLCKDIKKGIKSVFACTIDAVKVLPNKQLPQSAYYKPRNRYLANVLLRDLPETANPIYIIGLTHKDISFKIHNSENYGIMGLTPLAKNKSIVSDYRVKGKDFIAVIVHEFGHGLYGATHCSDKNCIMCDYQKHKGKPFKFSLCNNHIYM